MSDTPVAPSLQPLLRPARAAEPGGSETGRRARRRLPRHTALALRPHRSALRPARRRGPAVETVVELLLEVQRAWALDRPESNPFREREIRQHIGDYTLFMTGIFPEHVERRASTGLYVREGKRAYRVVADFQRSALKPDARLFAALSSEFENYGASLRYMKRVYLRAADSPPSFQPVLRLLTEW